MLKKSRNIFILFEALTIAGLLVISFMLINTTLLNDTTLQNAWITMAIALSSLFMALLMNKEKVPPLIRILLSLLVYGVFLFGIKYFQLLVLERLVTTLPTDLALGVITLTLFLLNLIFTWILQKRFKHIYILLKQEQRFAENEQYLTYVREQLSGQGVHQHASKVASNLSNLAILLLIFSFTILVLQPGYKIILSIAFVVYSLSALGIYLLTYQFQSLLEWKLKGFSLPERMTHNWNRLIFLLLSLSFIVSLSLPWYFTVFDFSTLNQGLKDRLSGVNISINPSPGDIKYIPPTKNQSSSTNQVQLYVISSLDTKVWKGIDRSKTKVLKDIQALKVKLSSPSLTRQIFTLDKYGPEKLYSHDLALDDTLIVLSSNFVLAELAPDGQILMSFVVEKQMETTIIETQVDEVQQSSVRMASIRIIMWSILGLFAFYFLSALIGGILMIKYRYTRRPKLAQFFINRYNSVKGLVNAIFFFFRLIGRFFLALLGLGKRKKKIKEDLSSPVAKQLFSLFNEKEDMSDEKKEEVMTIIKEFVKLIDTTSRLIVPYRYFYGPKEYLDKVIGFQPNLKKILEKISSLFNECRYSKHMLGETKLKTFSGSVAFAMEQINKLDVGLKSQSEQEGQNQGL